LISFDHGKPPYEEMREIMIAKDKVEEIISTALRIEPERVNELPGDELLSTIGLDSLNCMEIVIQIEEFFGIAFEDEELLLENLNTLNKLMGLIDSKLDQNVSA
jgi:acyl carrier protein